MQVRYIWQKYTLNKYTLERYTSEKYTLEKYTLGEHTLTKYTLGKWCLPLLTLAVRGNAGHCMILTPAVQKYKGSARLYSDQQGYVWTSKVISDMGRC